MVDESRNLNFYLPGEAKANERSLDEEELMKINKFKYQKSRNAGAQAENAHHSFNDQSIISKSLGMCPSLVAKSSVT